MITARDNLLDVLRHKEPQWIPCCPHIANEYNIPGQLPEELLKEPLDRLAISKFVGGDLLYEIFPAKAVYPDEINMTSKTENGIARKTIDTSLGEISTGTSWMTVETPKYADDEPGLSYPGPMALSTITEFPIKDKGDYRILENIYQNTSYVFDDAAIKQSMSEVAADGVTVLGGGPSSPLYALIARYTGLEKLVYDLSDYAKTVMEVMDVMTDKNCQWYEQAVKTEAEVIRCSEDLDAGLVSPEMFKKYSVPALKKYAHICHDSGKILLMHMCGHIKDFLELIKETGVDAVHCLCPPLTGNTPLKLARSVFGKNIVIMARIDPPVLLEGTPEEVSSTVIEMLKEVAPADNFVLIMPCGRAALSNVRAVVDTVKNYGKYPVRA